MSVIWERLYAHPVYVYAILDVQIDYFKY